MYCVGCVDVKIQIQYNIVHQGCAAITEAGDAAPEKNKVTGGEQGAPEMTAQDGLTSIFGQSLTGIITYY